MGISKVEQVANLFFSLYRKDKAMEKLEGIGIYLQSLPLKHKRAYIKYLDGKRKRLTNNREEN